MAFPDSTTEQEHTVRLQDKAAIVVGAGQTPGDTVGNGRACAVRFAQEGARVMCVDRDLDRAQATVEEIERAGGIGVAYAADVVAEAACASMIDETVSAFGRIDILHNNVGIGTHDTGPSDMTEEIWDSILDTNLKGVVWATKHTLPVMRRQGSGSIINISSVAAVCAVGLAAYKASKAALNAYTHAVAMGNARYGIRANVIMPGLMNTPMAIEGFVASGRDREELIAQRNAAVPLKGGMGSATDIANAALFLASDEAAFITGVNLPVDGGQSAKIG
jgi:NAD(P)-dependent dehydrogenase (short-subunit alcohol dehydrogenase family)